jgi:ABC-type multidrug transport system permease subunit
MKLDRKRALLSTGSGFFIAFGLFVFVLLVTAFKAPDWILTALTWVLGWQFWLWLLRFIFPFVGHDAVVWTSICVGVLVDALVFSALIYTVLSVFKTKSPAPSLPPPPQFR